MYSNSLKSQIKVNLSNIPGWSTKRKIVVIESDDWGSVRMSSRKAFDKLQSAGIKLEKNHYNKFDALEGNQDLEALFDMLLKFKDKSGRPPVMTGVNIVGNPDFEAIKKNKFNKYVWEPFSETLKRYPKHDKVFQLWKEGLKSRLLVPTFHGREHLNVQRWMKSLREKNPSVLLGFENGITGISKGINNVALPKFQAAFDIDKLEDVLYQQQVLKEGLETFEKLYNYKSTYFVPTNGPFNNSLESVLYDNGVKYINSGKIQKEPLGDEKYKTNFRYLGKKNRLGQIYLTRNCFFEPSSMEHPASTDWVGNCLKEIEIAFKWHKPATISSHRVNYIGFLHEENRTKSLKQLDELFSRMLKKWPDIEFMTSMELGDLITKEK